MKGSGVVNSLNKNLNDFDTLSDDDLANAFGGGGSVNININFGDLVDSVKGFMDGITGHKRHYG
ncbi:MAG: ComC/BlpC family leader-containing pheromone/bacteriocin [Lactobacillaceae bacterium]|jgi:hypothetical protein|nr:ComC/BlpC family leader-containing pheromone/bacteriocin [Lactobacillaceae bacterium]